MNDLRVLIVLEYYYPNIGGVETLFKSLVEALVKRGVKVTILTNKFRKGLPFKETVDGVTIYRVPFVNRYIFTLLGCFPAWWLSLKHDVIHTTSYNAGIPAYVAGLFSRRKVLITFHEAWGDLWYTLPFMSKFMQWGHYTFERILLNLNFHKFIAVSGNTQKCLIAEGIDASRVVKIYNGMDYSEFTPYKKKRRDTPNDPFTFIYYGRLGISKGLDILIDAIKLLKENNTHFVLNMVIPTEPPSMYKRIMGIIEDRDVSSHIVFHHDLKRQKLFDLIVDSDCTVVPSYSEGFGYTALESVAMGIPVIVSPNGSLPEVISGKHIIMPTFDAQGLMDAMLEAMEGNYTLKINQEFTLDKSVAAYIDMYKSLQK